MKKLYLIKAIFLLLLNFCGKSLLAQNIPVDAVIDSQALKSQDKPSFKFFCGDNA